MKAWLAGSRRRKATLAAPALTCVAAVALAVLALAVPSARAQGVPRPSSRVALVIGEGAYRAGPLPAAPDDAGLVAQLLAGAGFDVTGARDLDGDGLHRAFRDFLDRAGAAGPDGIAVVYFAGRAIQADGDDFLVPIDARLARPSDVPLEALRLADFTHALAALPIQARVVIVDGAYGGGPAPGAAGLALTEAEQGELLAFNAAPGTVSPPTSGPYGAYAQALVAAMKQGGVPIGEVFDRVRLAVNQTTNGAVVPWDSDKLTRSFTLFDRAPDAPAVASAQVPFAALEQRPLRDFPPAEAYDVAIARDTLPAYSEFLAAFPRDPLARRIGLILAVRREALFWRAALQGNAPGAFWTYLARYPKGPHAADARRRLTRLAAAAAPPPRFVPLGFDVPPPGPDEIVHDRVIVFDAPDLPPPPPPPVFLLPPPTVIVLQRPAPPPGPVFLPVPVPVAIPYVRPPLDPGTIRPPRGITGDYPQSRPFMRGPNGDGLVVQSAPSAAEGRPRPPAPDGAFPNPVPKGALPSPAPAGVVQPRPPGVPPPVPSQTPPRVPSTALPVPPLPADPKAPAVAQPRPVPNPSQPSGPGLPVLPVAPVPPAARPAPPPPSPGPTAPAATQRPPASLPQNRSAPAGLPVLPPPAPAPRPALPRFTTFPGPQPRTEPRASPAAPLPGTPGGHISPAETASPAVPAAPPPAAANPRRIAPAPLPAGVAPAPRPPVPEHSPVPALQPTVRQAAPERMPAPPPTPRPAASERPALDRPGPAAGTGRPPGDRRPACGHPGEPPCRP